MAVNVGRQTATWNYLKRRRVKLPDGQIDNREQENCFVSGNSRLETGHDLEILILFFFCNFPRSGGHSRTDL